jgi:hypothetical protein
LDASWKFACETHFKSTTPDIDQIKALGRGEPFQILECSSSTAGGRKKTIPFVGKDRLSTNQQKEKEPASVKGLN